MKIDMVSENIRLHVQALLNHMQFMYDMQQRVEQR